MDYKLFIKGVSFFLFIILLIYIISILTSLYYGQRLNDPKHGKIGLIEIEGIILSSKSYIKQLKKFEKNDSVKAVVIRIDSPGGGVVPSQEIHSEILKFREKTGKKVVVSFGNIATSGSYYIACAADKIVTNPGTITGSIGVIMKIPNIHDLLQKIGFEEQIIKSGDLKDIGSISRSLTKKERQILEEMTQDVYGQFIEAVSESRDIDIAIIKKISDGRIFSGKKAKELNLIDTLGTIEDAIDLASKLAGLSEEPDVIKIKEKYSISELIKDLIYEKSLIDLFNRSALKIQYMLPY